MTDSTVPSRHLFWYRWLVVVDAAVILLGVAMVLAPGPLQQVLGLIEYGSADHIAGFGRPAVAYIRFAHAVLGAVMAGWGVCMLLVLYGRFRLAAWDGWITLAGSLAVWFALDTSHSLWSGFWPNAILNTALAVLFTIPLAATCRACYIRRSGA